MVMVTDHTVHIRREAMIGWILVILLVLLLLSVVPAYPYSRTWGYAPSGLVGLLLLILIIMLLMGVF